MRSNRRPHDLVIHMLIQDVSLSATQKITYTFLLKDKKGIVVFNPTIIDRPDWSGGAGIVQLFPSDDGMKCEVDGLTPGEFDIHVSLRVSTPAGVAQLLGTGHVRVTAS